MTASDEEEVRLEVQSGVPLARYTTLELGGPARRFVEVKSALEARAALALAREIGLEVRVLGGGSNLLVADAGVDALVLRVASRGIATRAEGDRVLLTAQAGEPWDAVVAHAVAHDLAGIECLSGIPGSAGATPIQNVGAYGQEVGDVISSIEVLDRASHEVRVLRPEDCAFAYRDSAFKRDPDRHLVLSVTFALVPGGAPSLRYAELVRAVGDSPGLAEVRESVLALRRKKSMVIDPADPNRRSAGSFFTNPIVSDAEADRVVAHAVATGLAERPEDVPRHPAGPGRSKLAAGWLIERAGIAKGTRRGNVGVSSRHALGLVHHGGGTTRELLALAAEIRDAVADRFGITLTPEPVFWGT